MRIHKKLAGLLVVGAVVLALVLTGQRTTPSAEALFGDTDNDGAVDAMETVSGSDPNDPGSLPEELFWSLISDRSACDDGIDNDGDGMADEADSGCQDDDEEGASNSLEAIMGSDPDDPSNTPENSDFDGVLASLGFGFFQTCANGDDDDQDGGTDAEDDGCELIQSDSDAFDDRTEKLFHSDPTDGNSVPEHDMPNAGSCSDGIDNDDDGMTDAAEISCRAATNDDFADARAITTIPFEDAVKVTSATTEPDEPQSDCFFDPIASVWYRYTATSLGALAVDTAGSNFPNGVAVWTRPGSQFREVGCAQSTAAQGAGVGARVSFQAQAGETYYIQISGDLFTNTPADLHVRLEVGTPPANDNFDSPTEITSLPFEQSLNISDATAEFGEPSGDCVGDMSSTVWYSYTAPGDQVLIAETTGSSFSPAVAAWTDSPFGLTEVACASFNDRVAIPVESGVQYYIQVGASEGQAGQLHFQIDLSQPLPNDDFADAMNVTVPFEETVDMFTATLESGEPEASCGLGLPGGSVWYRVTPQQTGYIRASTPIVSFEDAPAVLAIYQGSSLASLTELDCTNPFFGIPDGSSSVAVQVTAGQTYFIQLTLLGLFFEGAVPDASGETAGFIQPGTEVTIRIESFTVPSCAPATFSASPVGAPFIFGPPAAAMDVTSVSGGSDGQNYCWRFQFAAPLPPPTTDFGEPSYGISFGFDTDLDPSTGNFDALAFPCDGGLGSEVWGSLTAGEVLVSLGTFPPPPIPLGGLPQPFVGYARYNERSIDLIIPMSLMGDDRFRTAASIGTTASSECVPRAGGLTVPGPVLEGDGNCDGEVDTIDSSLILQRFAGLLDRHLPCESDADVNRNGDAGPIDAVLILQYAAGMIDEF